MYDEEGRWIPTSGEDYRLMLKTKLEEEVEEIKQKEEQAELEDLGIEEDEFDPIVRGEE